ncbi:MAG: cation:proton antiporter, partial [Planctomycetales bacterium]|nr:cation:proton antiporter [Planctomycetales bacterium]
IAFGFLLPWLVVKLERQRFLRATGLYKPLLALAIGLTLYAITITLHWNEFLAAFIGGITLATISPEVRDAYHRLGEILAELLKLAALLLFGVLISVELFRVTTVADCVFIILTLLVARTLALGLALLGSRLSWRERLVAAWFGPKGFASVVYGLLILNSDLSDGRRLFHLIACVAGLSIILHSSTDVAIARWFVGRTPAKQPSLHDKRSASSESETLEKLDEP